MHAKIGIVDDRWLTIGSANLNEHSFFNDTEMNLVADDAELARATRLRLWSEHLECDASRSRPTPTSSSTSAGDPGPRPDSTSCAPGAPCGRGSSGCAACPGGAPGSSARSRACWWTAEMGSTLDSIVVGGGFAGVAAAREIARDGGRALLLEGRSRLGGRTWTAPWGGAEIEYGGGWVHWHQPHTWSEIRRHGLAVRLSDAADRTLWYVGDELRSGTAAERDAIARRGWDRFVADVGRVLPQPHDPLYRAADLARLDGLTIARRMEEIELDDEERAVLTAELESLAHGFLDDAGAVSVLRWHALAGGSLELTQYAGGRVTIRGGTRALVEAIAGEAPVERRFGAVVRTVTQERDVVEVTTEAGETFVARSAIVTAPLNTLGAISFDPPLSPAKREAIALGQASRGVKIFIRARGDQVDVNTIRPGHPFGYLATEILGDDGSQLLIGFGRDSAACDASDLVAVQSQLEAILPGYEAVAATAHDWLGDELARGTWAIHRPGWYSRFHAEMQRPERRVTLAGSDLADGWAGFMDGAIESGVRAGRAARRWIGG